MATPIVSSTQNAWMIPYILPGQEPPRSYDESKYKFQFVKYEGMQRGALIPRDRNTAFVSASREQYAVNQANKILEPVTIYSDDPTEIQELKWDVAQKRQTLITTGAYSTKQATMNTISEATDWVQDLLGQAKLGGNVGTVLKGVGIGTGVALAAGIGTALVSRYGGNGNMGIGSIYAQLDENLGGYLPGGITPTQNNIVDMEGGVIGAWNTGTATFYKLGNGKMAVVKKDGRIKVYRPYHPLVFGKKIKSGDFLKLANRYRKTYQGLNKIFGRRTLPRK